MSSETESDFFETTSQFRKADAVLVGIWTLLCFRQWRMALPENWDRPSAVDAWLGFPLGPATEFGLKVWFLVIAIAVCRKKTENLDAWLWTLASILVAMVSPELWAAMTDTIVVYSLALVFAAVGLFRALRSLRIVKAKSSG